MDDNAIILQRLDSIDASIKDLQKVVINSAVQEKRLCDAEIYIKDLQQIQQQEIKNSAVLDNRLNNLEEQLSSHVSDQKKNSDRWVSPLIASVISSVVSFFVSFYVGGKK